MNSFALLRTNVGLTTNVKIMVSATASTYFLYLESIDSDPQLSDTQYKKFQFSSNDFYDELVPSFFNDLPVDTAFGVKYDSDSDNMFTSFNSQYDDIYQMGCRNIIDNKNYVEDFECFAPLYVNKGGKIPSNFVVFRIDGPGLISLDRDNFIPEIISNLKCVTMFDITTASELGKWIDNCFINNPDFPDHPFYMDFRDLEFSTWSGIDYQLGGYVDKSSFLDSTLEYENTYYDFQSLIYNGYLNNQLVFPNILNLSFLFNDNPATPNSLRTWSINRYMGFYMDDIELVRSVSVFNLPQLQPDVIVLPGNILMSPSFGYPFIINWDNITVPYVEIGGIFYSIEQDIETSTPEIQKHQLSTNVFIDGVYPTDTYLYKIIGNTDFSGLTYGNINNDYINIDVDNRIYLIDGSDMIPEYDSADVWLININGIYHNIVQNNGDYYLNTDYAFSVTLNQFQYWINSPDSNYSTTINLIPSDSNIPFSFNIYRCKFTDIKDFDTSIVDTEYSKFEYDINDTLISTDETKMYYKNYDSLSTPQSYDDFIINGQVVNIPCTSEYTANGELFRIQNNDITSLWRKNSSTLKWGYQGSISSNDYPYLLNNSFLSEDYNRSVNVSDPNPSRLERNLDYFYTINSSTSSYHYHTLHVQNETTDGDIDTSFQFEIDKYLNVGTYSFDYFTSFFGKKSTFNSGDIIKNTQKWSDFNEGDNVIPNTTLFRGIKFNIYDVEDIKVDTGNVDSLNVTSINNYSGYKLSILLSSNNMTVLKDIGLTSSYNGLSWEIIDIWKPDTTYNTGDIINYYDILYIGLTQNSLPVTQEPTNGSLWNYYGNTYSVFYNPQTIYSDGDFVYNSGEYFYYNSSGVVNFWISQTYTYGEIVLFNNQLYQSIIVSNNSYPGDTSAWIEYTGIISMKWILVNLWSALSSYSQGDYVVQNDILYQLSQPFSYGEDPSISINWSYEYSIIPNPNFFYQSTDNNIILLNNRYYLCTSTASSSTLDDGIDIYINKLYKNILINIYVNDNTLNNLSNSNRDDIYNDLYSKLTASNFMNCINDLSNFYGFSNYTKYIIINEDLSLEVYDFNNISDLPIIIGCQGPDEVYSRISSLDISSLSLQSSQFSPQFVLNNGTILTENMINYYNNLSLATDIEQNKGDTEIIPNYHGLTNNIYNVLYRHSGYYSPILYTIQLFQRVNENTLDGNYKFDTSLTEFGIMKERIVSKVNRSSNILLLGSTPNVKSIYPMIDEIGYTTLDFFIFKSTWDYNYYIECTVSAPSVSTTNETLNIQ